MCVPAYVSVPLPVSSLSPCRRLSVDGIRGLSTGPVPHGRGAESTIPAWTYTHAAPLAHYGCGYPKSGSIERWEVWEMTTRNLMRAVLLFVLLSPTLVAAQGQTSTDARNAISIDVLLPIGVPISLLVGERSVLVPVQVQYQRVVADHLVLLVTAGLNYGWTLPPRTRERSLDIYSVVEVGWHPFHRGLKGFHVGLSGFFSYGAIFTDAVATKATAYGYRLRLGPTLGWQFLLPANITIDTAFGLGFGPAVDVDSDGVRTSGFLWDPTRAGVFLGFRF